MRKTEMPVFYIHYKHFTKELNLNLKMCIVSVCKENWMHQIYCVTAKVEYIDYY